jgi:hypothetical protein
MLFYCGMYRGLKEDFHLSGTDADNNNLPNSHLITHSIVSVTPLNTRILGGAAGK